MLSTPGALPTISHFMTNSVLHTMNSQDQLESHPWALRSSWILAKIALAKCLSLLRDHLLLSGCEVMEFAVIWHCVGVVDLPISLLMVCQARRLEYIKSMDSTVSVHFSLCLSLSLVKRSFAASPITLFISASLWIRSMSSHSPSQHGM